MQKSLSIFAFSVFLLVLTGNQAVFAASMTIDQDAIMTVGDDATITIDTDDSNILENQGTLNIDSDGTINIGSNTFTLLRNSGTINGPGEINLFGSVIEIENTGEITAIINEFLTIVGGEIIQIESTAVLLAGVHMTASWLIPVVIASIGIGIVIARRM